MSLSPESKIEAPKGTDPPRSRFRTLRAHARHHGLWSAILLLLLTPLRRLGIIWVGGVYLSPTETRGGAVDFPDSLEARFLSHAEVRALVRNGAEWFFPQAVERSLALGERCFAVLEGDTVIHSRWYAAGPLRQFGVELEAPERALFFHRVYTDHAWRGQGLAVRAQLRAKQHLSAEGISWLACTIEVTNASSIAAERKGGGARVGWLLQIGPDSWRSSFLVRTDARCPKARRRR